MWHLPLIESAALGAYVRLYDVCFVDDHLNENKLGLKAPVLSKSLCGPPAARTNCERIRESALSAIHAVVGGSVRADLRRSFDVPDHLSLKVVIESVQ